MNPQLLAKMFRENMILGGKTMSTDFADALRVLSDYILTEQFLIRKDNNSNIKK